MLPLCDILEKHGVSFHCYDDDTQIYMTIKKGNTKDLDNLTACLQDLTKWMSLNFLHLNKSKAEIILFGSVSATAILKPKLKQFTPNMRSYVKDLGIRIDNELKMVKMAVVQSSFFHLRQIAKFKPFLNFSDTQKIIYALISSHLDYCNLLYHSINKSTLSWLQLVQNAAARLLTQT